MSYEVQSSLSMTNGKILTRSQIFKVIRSFWIFKRTYLSTVLCQCLPARCLLCKSLVMFFNKLFTQTKTKEKSVNDHFHALPALFGSILSLWLIMDLAHFSPICSVSFWILSHIRKYLLASSVECFSPMLAQRVKLSVFNGCYLKDPFKYKHGLDQNICIFDAKVESSGISCQIASKLYMYDYSLTVKTEYITTILNLVIKLMLISVQRLHSASSLWFWPLRESVNLLLEQEPPVQRFISLSRHSDLC